MVRDEASGVLWRLTPDRSLAERLRRADDGLVVAMIVCDDGDDGAKGYPFGRHEQRKHVRRTDDIIFHLSCIT